MRHSVISLAKCETISCHKKTLVVKKLPGLKMVSKLSAKQLQNVLFDITIMKTCDSGLKHRSETCFISVEHGSTTFTI